MRSWQSNVVKMLENPGHLLNIDGKSIDTLPCMQLYTYILDRSRFSSEVHDGQATLVKVN